MAKCPALGLRWMALAAMIIVVVLGLTLVPTIIRHAEAATFIDAAVTIHRSYQENQLPLEIRSSSPEAVTAWFAGKVSFLVPVAFFLVSAGGHPAGRSNNGSFCVNGKHKLPIQSRTES